MIYKLALGDWSEDGHGISKDVLIGCNCSNVNDIRNAYKASCRKLGVQFNNGEDYTGKNLADDDPHLIWTKYQENDMSAVAYDILDKAGCFDEVYIEKDDNGRYYVESPEECACIIMSFIALSMLDDFRYSIVKERYPYINGHWNKGLDIQIGYGLFDN